MIVVPYVAPMLRAETAIWARHAGATLIELPKGDNEAYWRLLAHHWTRPGDLVVVEQDIVPAPGVVGDMLACDQLWCASPYWVTGRWLIDGLGCTKFSSELKSAEPDLLTDVGAIASPDGPERAWWLLDDRLSRLLRSLDRQPHEHERSTHLHDY
jgi:hypothetical protein